MTPASNSPLRIAALDLGSLTVRLAVAEVSPGGMKILAHHREITALGEELAQTGFLTEAAMARTIEALRGFSRLMEDYKVAAYDAVATHAVRQARDRRKFLDRIRDSLGLKVRVLTPEEEARLSLQGVFSALAPEYRAEALVVFDVGGGSSEFTLARPGREPVFAGLPMGVLILSQAHPLGDPPRPERLAALRQKLERQLSEFYEQFFAPHLSAPPRLVGTAGAVTTLAAMALKMKEYDPGKVNNLILTRARLDELTELICGLTEAQRALLPGMEPGKAGVMPAGALIIQAILRAFRQDSLVVIDVGLLEGVLLELISRRAKRP